MAATASEIFDGLDVYGTIKICDTATGVPVLNANYHELQYAKLHIFTTTASIPTASSTLKGLYILDGEINKVKYCDGASWIILGNMDKSVYDTTNNGIVDNSEKLGGQLPSYYLDPANLSTVVSITKGGTGLSTLGGANQVLGVNNGATALEYKTISGTANKVTVTHSAGGVTFSTPQETHATATPTFAQISVTNAPVNANDVVRKTDLDAAKAGLMPKMECMVATTANIANLLTAFPTVIDGYELVVNDRILVKHQTLPKENGIYIYTAANVVSRATDANTWEKLIGAYVWVNQGITYGDMGWSCAASGAGTIGTTDVVWNKFSAAGRYEAGTGMTLDGNTLNVKAGSGITVNADSIEVKPLSTGAILVDGTGVRVSVDNTTIAVVGNALSVKPGMQNKHAHGLLSAITGGTPFDITHGLGAVPTRVEFYRASASANGNVGNPMYPAITVIDATKITVSFSASLNANTVRWIAEVLS